MASQPLGRSGVRITKHRTHPKEDAMPTSRFIQRFGDRITGVLSGFDRLVLRGSLLAIVSVEGMKRLLWLKHVLLKDFGRWAQRMTEQLKEASCQAARACLLKFIATGRATSWNRSTVGAKAWCCTTIGSIPSSAG